MARPTSLTADHMAHSDSAKPRRRRLVNNLVGELTAQTGSLIEFNRMRTRISGLPGNGLLVVSGHKKATEGLTEAHKTARDEAERSADGWAGVLHEHSTIGHVVTLPLPAFLYLMRRLEEQQ